MVPITSSIHLRDRMHNRVGAPVTVDYLDLDANAGILNSQIGSGQFGPTFVATDTGSANAYAIAPASPPLDHTAGTSYTFTPANSSTGPSTLAVSGLTPQNIFLNGSAIGSSQQGALTAGAPVTVTYDGTQFNITGTPGFLVGRVQHKLVPLTTANLKAMYAAPVNIVAAPGSGLNLVFLSAVTKFIYGTAVFTGGGDVLLQYAATANGAGTNVSATVIDSGAAVFTGGSSGQFFNTTVGNAAIPSATGIYISNKSAALASATGTSTATVDIWYMVV